MEIALRKVVAKGVKAEASAVHIDPYEAGAVVRYRMGSRLSTAERLGKKAQDELLREIKKLAKLDHTPAGKPQEASFELATGNQTLKIELSIVPLVAGEKAVLHIRPGPSSAKKLEDIGYWGKGLSALRYALAEQAGLLLVAGYARSGIGETLDALAGLFNSPPAKIGRAVVSTENAAETLREVLQHDPDIVTASNLPDRRTANLALESALGRRLVMAGIHADGSISALAHLRALGVEPFMLASVTRLAAAQRRVRRLCPSCREKITLDHADAKQLHKHFSLTPDKIKQIHQLEQAALKSGMGEPELCSTPSGITHLWQPNAEGCSDCFRGYSGRIALTEVLPITANLQKLLAQDKPPTPKSLEQAATLEGFIPLKLDGLVKCLRGQTTVEEVWHA